MQNNTRPRSVQVGGRIGGKGVAGPGEGALRLRQRCGRMRQHHSCADAESAGRRVFDDR